MYSAGVLLYTKRKDEVYFLLGCDCKYQSWSDMGGKCDDSDRRDPLKTASREFYEETCGIIFSKQDIYKLLLKNGVKIECSSYKKNKYYMFLLEVFEHQFKSFDEIIRNFELQAILINSKPPEVMRSFREKNQLRWFTLQDILSNKIKIRGVFYYSFIHNLHVINEVCA